MIIFHDKPVQIGCTETPLSFDDLSADTALDILGVNKLALLKQVHGTSIHEVDYSELASKCSDKINFLERADGIVVRNIEKSGSNSKIAVGIRTADCLPIVLLSSSTLLMLHAGWRGLAAGLLERSKDYFDKETEIKAFIGPAAKKCCYEVGTEVFEALKIKNKTASLKIDLQDIAAEILLKSGLKLDLRVEDYCTICSQNFHSYRRNKTIKRNLTFALL